ncbi:extracellular solute-binding protein [Brevibacterium litoralis]|uniref:extracellular solute-binding protein n=1 Tax=Brevibacterium litoralis TaxID=3138935 RepID=UPI0032EEB603
METTQQRYHGSGPGSTWRTGALGVIGAGACLVLLAGCMSGSGGGSAEVDTAAFEGLPAGEAPEGALEGTDMTFVSYGGIYQDMEMEHVVDPFATHTGANVLSDGPTDLAKLRAQVESGTITWDTVEASPVRGTALCGDLFQPLDDTLIDRSVIPENLPQGECFVPIMVYAHTFFYDADKYGDNPPTTWADFFDTENFPGVRGLEGRASPTPGTYETALMADGVAEEDLYPLDTDRALSVYDRVVDDAVFWTSGAEQTQLIQGGEVDMLIGWSGRIPEVNRNGQNWKPVWDGGIVDSDILAITAGSDNVVASHSLINWFLGAEQQTVFTETTAYPPVNPEATPEMDEVAAEVDVSDPEILDQLVRPDYEYWAENYDELNETWHRYVSQG